jgi:hypothetical protein
MRRSRNFGIFWQNHLSRAANYRAAAPDISGNPKFRGLPRIADKRYRRI